MTDTAGRVIQHQAECVVAVMRYGDECPVEQVKSALSSHGLREAVEKITADLDRPYCMAACHAQEVEDLVDEFGIFTPRDFALLWQYAHRLEQRNTATITALQGEPPTVKGEK